MKAAGDAPAVKPLYKCREVELVQEGCAYIVRIAGEETRGSFTNPLLAWGCFIDVLDGRVRRRIGDMLEREGKNRYTGQLGKRDVTEDAG